MVILCDTIHKDVAFASVLGPAMLSLVNPIFGIFIFNVLRRQRVIFADVVVSMCLTRRT